MIEKIIARVVNPACASVLIKVTDGVDHCEM